MAAPLVDELTKSLGSLAGNLDNVRDATAFVALLQERYTTLGQTHFEELLAPVKALARKVVDVHIASVVCFFCMTILCDIKRSADTSSMLRIGCKNFHCPWGH